MKKHGIIKDALVRAVPLALVLAIIAAILSYWHAREIAKASDNGMLVQNMQRALPPLSAQASEEVKVQLAQSVRTLADGLFVVAQAYSPTGEKLAEAVRPGFEAASHFLSLLSHLTPSIAFVRDEPVIMGTQSVRVVAPVFAANGAALGHVEAIRILGPEDLARYHQSAIVSALIAAVSVLLSVAAVVPIMTMLVQRQYRWACSLLGAHLGILEAFGRAIARRDSDTGLHNYRVTWIAARIGEEAGLSSAQLRNLIAGAFLHDVGKIGVPDAILLKPGPLDAHERASMQAHVDIGTYIVGSVGFLGARDVIAAHHEKWDGSGYPHQLAGEAIPLNARIFCIADVYDALRAKRPYKEAFGLERTMEIMSAEVGRHFDPALFACFERLVTEFETKVINADEEQVIALMRQMTEKHFFSSGPAMAKEGWSGQGCGDGKSLQPGQHRIVSGQTPSIPFPVESESCCPPKVGATPD